MSTRDNVADPTDPLPGELRPNPTNDGTNNFDVLDMSSKQIDADSDLIFKPIDGCTTPPKVYNSIYF
jgi:hypothetical protein